MVFSGYSDIDTLRTLRARGYSLIFVHVLYRFVALLIRTVLSFQFPPVLGFRRWSTDYIHKRRFYICNPNGS